MCIRDRDKKVSAKKVCLALMDEGILAKETHATVIRFAPPLIITKEEIDWAMERIKRVLNNFAAFKPRISFFIVFLLSPFSCTHSL